MRAKTSSQQMFIYLSCLMMVTEIQAQCSRPDVGGNRILTTESDKLTFRDGETVEVQCVPGYKPAQQIASRKTTCNGDQWTMPQFECKKSCGYLHNFPNGNYYYSQPETLFGGTATAQCAFGYKVVGRKTRTCQDEGWDGEHPVCEVWTCSKPKIINGRLEVPHEKYFYREGGSASAEEIHDRACVYVDFLETGQNVTLRPGVNGKKQFIWWKHNGKTIVKFTQDWWEDASVDWYQLGHRAHLNAETGEFTLMQLTSRDSGVYQCETRTGRHLMRSRYVITVMDAVSTPQVMCLSNDTETEEITLQCSVDPPAQANFTWSGPHGFTRQGDKVQINKTTDHNSTYSCTAENTVSNKTVFIAVKDCFSESTVDVETAEESLPVTGGNPDAPRDPATGASEKQTD
ncbi:uncharacterized protein LOC143484951 [Brachyhypopomus gauderio]|uniref:uncharacterized protein LOC143484951 n=1 Tax=Brachyhypopomus gauderio TaxID=698409 RepID=UPI004041D459